MSEADEQSVIPPLSLDDIVTTSLNYENLKSILTYMLSLIKNQSFKIGELERREVFSTHQITMMIQNNDEVIDLGTRNDALMDRIVALEKKAEETKSKLKEKQVQLSEIQEKQKKDWVNIEVLNKKFLSIENKYDDPIAALEDRMSDDEKAIVIHESRLEEFDERLLDIRKDFDDMSSMSSMPRGPGGMATSAKTLELLNKLRDMDSKFKDIEIKSETNSNQIHENYKKLKEALDKTTLDASNSLQLTQSNRERLDEMVKMTRLIQDELNDKANADDFDVFRQQVNAMGPSSHNVSSVSAGMPVIPTKEINLMKDNAKRIELIESDLQQYKVRSGNQLREINDTQKIMLSNLKDKIDGDALNTVVETVDRNKIELDRIKRQVDEIESRPPIIHTNAPSAPQDTARVHVLTLRIEEVETEVQRMKKGNQEAELWQETQKLWKELNESLNDLQKDSKMNQERIDLLKEQMGVKAGIEEIRLIEKKFGKLTENGSGNDHFATREDLKRAYKSLHTHITNITEYIVSYTNGGDDSMIAKKPLGGWSCAACNVNLDKLMGKVHGFKPWGPAEIQIPRTGTGFSKQISHMQSEARITTVSREDVSS